MVNFRAFRDKTLNFQDKPVVLLSATNGTGKTTTIDAIEWCLTGDIGRLRTSFDARSTNDSDRRMNTDGILKNKDAQETDRVDVTLWLLDGETECILRRVQQQDELNPDYSRVTFNGKDELAKTFIQNYIGDSFYNFHFCDVQKSFNVQNKKRKDLETFFSEFITNYDRHKQIAENLDIFAEDVNRYIIDKTKQKISQEIIQEYQQQYKTLSETSKQISYPPIPFYAHEKIEVSNLNVQELSIQKQALANCGYQQVTLDLSKLVENETLKNQLSVITEIASYWDIQGDEIQRALNADFLKDTDVITRLTKKLTTLQGLPLSKDTIFSDAETVLHLGIANIAQSYIDTNRKEIQEKNEKVQELTDEINLLTQNNKILNLLSSLSIGKKEVIEYRDIELRNHGTVRCPICGSESFATMNEDLILREADKYIRQNNEVVKAQQIKRNLLYDEIKIIYQKFISHITGIVEKEKEKLTREIMALNQVKNTTQPYFNAVKKLQMIRNTIDIDVSTAEKTNDLLIIIERQLLDKSQEQKIREEYEKILTVLGYQFEGETIQQTYEKVNKLITTNYTILEFSYDAFVSKLNSIDNILANQKLLTLQQTLQEYHKKNEILDQDIRELEKLKDLASQRANNIRETVENLSKDEYEKVGPTLSKFYNKLSRLHNNGIHIIPQNNGISLVDDKHKNIVNILSNGQISVFMLAYFFAGINARNNREKLKVFFIDDLTACMDDVNMLAFMDLIKYQMSSAETMKQLFFVTCDDRICNLLKYKLGGRGVEICELSEKDFT